MRVTRAAAASVALAGIGCCWGGAGAARGEATWFAGEMTPTRALSQVYFVFGTGQYARTAYTHKLADFVPAGETTRFSFSMDIRATDRATLREKWTVWGIYDDAHDGVSIAYEANAGTHLLASTIPGLGWNGTNIPSYVAEYDLIQYVGIAPYTEAVAAQSLRGGLPVEFAGDFNFFFYEGVAPDTIVQSPGGAPTNPTAVLLNFSGLSFGGTAAFREVPEPGMVGMVGLGGIALTGWRRRRG